MALLFHASTAFSVYEDALEAAGIPFVTVAGRGFYDRPEIRDLLNALAAIAVPSDDLALAGLLRSPAIGLDDADLYHLRFTASHYKPGSLWENLQASAVLKHTRAAGIIAQSFGTCSGSRCTQMLSRSDCIPGPAGSYPGRAAYATQY